MATSVRTHSNAINVKTNTVRLHTPQKSSDSTDTRLYLIQALQTTLDMNRILEIFFEQLQSIVPVRGMQYKNDAFKHELLQGSPSPHHVDYRLNLQQEELGELIFSRTRKFAESELEIIEGLIGALIFPLRNAVHYKTALQSALHDPLTGVGNRAGLDNTLSREISLAQRYQQPLSLMVIDIDFFKRINDAHGHSIGDSVIAKVAHAIGIATRQTDMTFSYGGEEFLVILNKTDIEGAQIIAERVRFFIEKLKINTPNNTVTTSVSIGVSALTASDTQNELFDRADKALYNAKHNGRNRVEIESITSAND
jgi:diguanylate cyclase (GGDEF)-like protein